MKNIFLRLWCYACCTASLWSVSALSFAQEISIKPKWKQGDERHIVSTSTIVGLLGRDTIISSKVVTRSKVKVDAVTDKGYIISYTNEEMETPKISMPALDSIDKAQIIFVIMNGLIEAAENATKNIAVKYRIDPSGEAVSVVNFDETFRSYTQATLKTLNDFTTTLKKTFKDTIDFPLDSTSMKGMVESLKDKFHEQLLNSVNYFNQAYYGVTYDKTKKKTFKSKIVEYDVLKYGNVEMNGRVITEVLDNSTSSFKIKFTTECDPASFKKAVKEQLKKELDGASFVDDWMTIDYEPFSFWIQKIKTFQHIKMNEIEIKSEENVVFQK